MTPELFANVLIFLVSFAGLWLLYSVAYLDYRRDVYRQKLFDLRVELFDLARSGRITFSEPAYGTVRTTLNGFIRFAHRVQFGALVLFMIFGRWRSQGEGGFYELFAKHTEHLDPEVKAQLQKIVIRMHWNAIEQLVTTSPILVITIVPVVLVLVMKHAGKVWPYSAYVWCRRKVKTTWIDAIDTAAFHEGSVVDMQDGAIAA